MTTVLISLTKLIKKIGDNLSDVYITGKNISDKYLFQNSKDFPKRGLYVSTSSVMHTHTHTHTQLEMASKTAPTTTAAPKKKIPVTILTGFLGSGKTTFLNYLLKENHGQKLAIVENEFGEVSIDDGLVMQTNEEVIEMMNGCICCTVREDLIVALKKLAKNRAGQFDAVVIETTGLAVSFTRAQTHLHM